MKTAWQQRTATATLAGLAALALAAVAQAQPGASAGPAPAQITVVVPADAKVFFNGNPTTQTGTERSFTSPDLPPGKKYSYEIRAVWTAAGKPVEETRTVTITAGAKVRVEFGTAAAKGSPAEEDAFQRGVEAYVYGYPLVTMDTTRQVMTNVAAPKGARAPMGQFAHVRQFATPASTDVVAPNADTLYSAAWIDVRQEPWVLHVPDEANRFYMMPVLDAWTNVIASPGTRTNGSKAGDYAISSRDWKGQLPPGVTQIKSPTNLVWILGRTFCTGTPEDYKAVHAIQDQYRLVPLSSFGKPYTPPAGKVDATVDMKTPPREQVNKMDASAYFKRLAALLKDNPPAAADAPVVAKLAQLGIVPGKPFDIAGVEPNVAKGLERAVQAGLAQVASEFGQMGKRVNGWQINFTGEYGTRYGTRAATVLAGLEPCLAKDAVTPLTDVDTDSKPLTGANRYVIHFDKKALPPVEGPWSLTMYTDAYTFVDNPLNRYALGSRDKLKENPDGSVDLYVQKDSPGKDKASNWLPAPEGRFVLVLRLYSPQETVFSGAWQPPPVQRAGK
jgi:uncharacterized protein (TIGR03000 family)